MVREVLAFATYSSLDGDLIARGLSPLNLVGPVGHRAASFLFRALGLAAPILAVGLFALGWRMLRGVPSRITLVGSLAYGVLILAVAALGQLALSGLVHLPFPPGGAAGAHLARFSARFLSGVGSAIAPTGLHVWPVLKGIGSGMLSVLAFGGRRIAAAVDEHRAAMAELREEEAERARLAAEELAESAEIEAGDDASRAEARAAAGALALEHVKRQLFEDPAWVDGFADPADRAAAAAAQAAEAAQAAKSAPAAPATEAAPRRKKAAAVAEAEDAESRALEDVPSPLVADADAKPEIVVSQALLDR